MVFIPPNWTPQCPDIPDNVPIPDFIFDDNYGRYPSLDSKPPFACGLSGKSYSTSETRQRIEFLARALSAELGWNAGEGTEWAKVLAVFSFNSIDTITLTSAAHYLDGIATMANAAYSAPELIHQIKSSQAKCIFTCGSLLQTATQAASQTGIPKNRIYILEVGNTTADERRACREYKTVDQLIETGKSLSPIKRSQWTKGQGARQCAYLCYSSGTSGLPKGVMISHRNVIANCVQLKAYERKSRTMLAKDSQSTEVVLGLLPQSHIYGLVLISYLNIYRGDCIVVLPKFEMQSYLQSIQKFRINTLYLVPPIIIAMINNKKCDQYDLSSVSSIFTGAAPLGRETAVALQKLYPSWKIRQGYGLTETCTVVCTSSAHDIWLGSSGSFLPGYKARIVSADGVDITSYDQAGELLVNSPSVVLGYLNNEKANEEAFEVDENGDRWLRTGDEALISKAPSGNEHVFIVDRIKELIKVKGMQVAPAELEAHLLEHPAVADAAVIPVADNRAGELPKAFIVKSADVASKDDNSLALDIQNHVKAHKAKHKWIEGGVEFIDVIPKSPSGKILRRLLRDLEKQRRRTAGPNL
ncbi:acyl-CoA synthetase [Xylogone sp. PMI_703]|nr:acyl-CoA synthetase [Xylogone sp. PMI_703]